MVYGIPYGAKEVTESMASFIYNWHDGSLFIWLYCMLNLLFLQEDPGLEKHRRELIESAAKALDKAKMIRFDERTTYLSPIDVGRIASNFYIKYDTIEVLYITLIVDTVALSFPT